MSEVSSTTHPSDLDDLKSVSSTRFIDVIPNIEQPKIESKDHMWKPAPIMGRDFTQREVTEPTVVNNSLGGRPYGAALRSEINPMT